MALYTQARRRGQQLSNRTNLRRNVTGGVTAGIAPGDSPKGQTDIPRPQGPNAQGYSPIRYGQNNQKWGYAKVGQARNQGVATPAGTTTGGGGAGGALGALSPAVRAALQEYGQGPIAGVKAIPGADREQAIAMMRRFLKNAQAGGVGNKGLLNMLQPSFYRGLSDPYGGGRLMNYAGKNFTPEEWKQLSRFANTNTGTVPSGENSVQNALFDASPSLGDQYMAQANSYKIAPNHADGMSTTPPSALLGSDGKWHDPEAPLPPGVTLDPASNPSSLPADRWWGGGNNRYQGTGQFATDPIYMHNADNRLGAGGTASTQQLGSDGQYHDIDQPLPPGVTLKPPQGATAPQTQPVSAVAEAAHGTPQAAINAGKDPTKHLAYWQDKGWVYNDATDQWKNRNAGGGGGGGASPAPVSTPAPAAVPAQAGAAAATMPLDPAYIAAQRAAQYQLNSTLQGTNPALEQINAQNQLALARMGTNQGYDTQALMEALSSRGALQSSIYGNELGNLATNYMRTGQDLAIDVANAQSQVYQQQQGAYNDYYAALIEALLSSAATTSTSSYTPVGNVNRKSKPKKKKRGNNRGRS